MNTNRMILIMAAGILLAANASPVQAQRPGRGPRVVSPEVADGKVTFRILAPDAKVVRLSSSDIPGNDRVADMGKSEEGVWETTLEIPPGYYRYQFSVDGVSVIDPRKSFHQRVKQQHLEPCRRARGGLDGLYGCAAWCCGRNHLSFIVA